ncbi:hypothetical protein [Falsiroseomonas sp. CW058]|uniref:hypothetical protein n=1 Tax=Falsiroseomonas sp. CW058 TaxID=3388664 RepID=UPI003D31A4E0
MTSISQLGLPVVFIGSGAPAAADDVEAIGARRGYWWMWEGAPGGPRWWVCRDPSAGAAEWDEIPRLAAIASAYAPLTHVGTGGAAHPAATTLSAGFMSAADKSKLDGIAPGAQVGTVTSVSLAVPGILTSSGGPVTTSGTLTIGLAAQGAGTVLAGPESGDAAAPSFRALAAGDIPPLSWSKIASGTPTTISGYGITDAQPLDATLTALAGLNATAGLVEQTGTDAFTKRAIGVGAATSIPTRGDGDTRWAALAHAHAATDITSGILADARLSGTYSDVTLRLGGASGRSIYSPTSTGSTATSGRASSLAALYQSSTASTTGAIVFRAPTGAAGIMHLLRVEGSQHSPAQIFSMSVYGYKQTLTSGWSGLRKSVAGTTDVQARFGVTPDGRNCLILGGVASAWSYPSIALSLAVFSFSGVTDAYCEGWTVELVTDLSAYTYVSADITNTVPFGSQPLDATLTALAGLNATAGLVEQTGTDAFTKRAIGVGATTSVPTRADGDARWAALSGPTFTGAVLIQPSASVANISLSPPSGQIARLDFVRGGVNRWQVYMDAATETGGGAGSNWSVARHSDGGAFVAAALSIRRSDGQATFEVTPTVGLNQVWHAGNSPSLAALRDGVTGAGTDPLDVPRATDLGSAAFADAMGLSGIFVGQQNSAYQAVPGDHRRLIVATSGAPVYTLPAAVDVPPGWCLAVKARGTSITVAAAGSDTIDGGSTLSVTTGTARWIVRSGIASYEVI